MVKINNSRKDNTQKRLYKVSIIVILVAVFSVAGITAERMPDEDPPVPYEPTHMKVVEAMLRLGNTGPNDIHYDLGCGDGRVCYYGC